jgi:hypothetical protein
MFGIDTGETSLYISKRQLPKNCHVLGHVIIHAPSLTKTSPT